MLMNSHIKKYEQFDIELSTINKESNSICTSYTESKYNKIIFIIYSLLSIFNLIVAEATPPITVINFFLCL